MLSPNGRTRKARLTPDKEWAALHQVVHNIAKTYLGKAERKHQDWLDPNDLELHTRMSRIDQAHHRELQTRSTRSTTAAETDACELLQKRTRALKSDWWERKAVELQRAADRNGMKGFYNGLKEVWGPKKKGPVHLKSTWIPSLSARELWQDRVNTSRSNSTSLAT